MPLKRGVIGAIEKFTRRRAVAPVQKAAFAARITLDHVEARKAPGQTHDLVGLDTFGLPCREHGVAERIVAQGRDIRGVDAEPREIERGIERVAAKAARKQTIRGG
jgi:hypothetical protein